VRPPVLALDVAESLPSELPRNFRTVEQVLERPDELVVIMVVERPVCPQRLPLENQATRIHQRGEAVVPPFQQHQAEALVSRRDHQQRRAGEQRLPGRGVHEAEPLHVRMIRNRHVRRSGHHQIDGRGMLGMVPLEVIEQGFASLVWIDPPQIQDERLADAERLERLQRSGRNGIEP
jgi:hypothetical protein